MGGQKSYIGGGGFSEYLYRQVGETISAGDTEGKVIEKYGSKEGHEGLPMYSNTSEVYMKRDDISGQVAQASD